MTKRPTTDRPPLLKNRRSGDDRRKVDVPRPALKDRRRAVDSRKPEVTELEMSSSEWATLNEQPLTPRNAS